MENVAVADLAKQCLWLEHQLDFSTLSQAEQVQVRKNAWHAERVAFLALQQKLQHSSSSVEWVNADGESGMPYDLVVRTADQVRYVEVKSAQGHHTSFKVSVNEIIFCHAQKTKALRRYDVCIVTRHGDGGDSVQVRSFELLPLLERVGAWVRIAS